MGVLDTSPVFLILSGRIARGSMQAGVVCVGPSCTGRCRKTCLIHGTRRVPCLPAPPTFEMTLATPRRNIFSPGNDDDPWGELEGRVCVRRTPTDVLAQVLLPPERPSAARSAEDVSLCLDTLADRTPRTSQHIDSPPTCC